MTHCDLRAQSAAASQYEISHCRTALEQITSLPCRSFCFPFGRFRGEHIQQVRDSGFSLARTVELMSLDTPRVRHGMAIMPTTLQALSGGPFTFLKNSIKRARVGNLVRHAAVRRPGWVATLEAVLEIAAEQGGVVHLWGHSWEVEQHSQWQNLDRAFLLLARYRHKAGYFSNGELWNRLAPSVPAAETPQPASLSDADAPPALGTEL